MIASDIPEGYRSPSSMARSLATYLDCPKEIRRRVVEVFGSSPSTHDIRAFRRRHLAPDHTEPYRPHEGYYPDEAYRAAERASRLFLARLEAERAISQASRRALLEEPDFANKRWDADIRGVAA